MILFFMDPIRLETKSDTKFNRFFGAIIIVQIISAIVGLSLLAGIIYVACHFLAKVW